MGTGMAATAVATDDAFAFERLQAGVGATDHELVAAVRRGDDRAFEELYSRYQRRIAAYVYGMVNDYGRAEDITQDVFISALRRMRETAERITERSLSERLPVVGRDDVSELATTMNDMLDRLDEALNATRDRPDDFGRSHHLGPRPAELTCSPSACGRG